MKSIEVPKGEVVYVVSSTLTGEVRSHRYGLTEKDEVKNAETERELARHERYLGLCRQSDDAARAQLRLRRREAAFQSAIAICERFRRDHVSW